MGSEKSLTFPKALFPNTENQNILAIAGIKIVAIRYSLILLPLEILAIKIPVKGTQASQKAQ